MSLANKRHHLERIKNNRAHYACVNYNGNKRKEGMAIKTPKNCACIFCINPRNYAGSTRQELKAELRFND